MLKSLMIVSMLFSFTAFADRLGTEGVTKTFDAEYESAWNAALVAIEDLTIESANKDVGQIITKAVKSTNFLGDKSTTTQIKIGRSKPIKVVVHVNIEKTVTTSGRLSRSATDTYSDDDAEKAIMQKIENELKPKK